MTTINRLKAKFNLRINHISIIRGVLFAKDVYQTYIKKTPQTKSKDTYAINTNKNTKGKTKVKLNVRFQVVRLRNTQVKWPNT